MIRPMQRVAVADMGSNSWRLVVFGYEPGTPWWSLVDEIREAVRVGAGMGEEGALRPERIDRALHTAAVFASFCRASGIEQVEAVATSAIRDATNGDELIEAIHARTGLEPRVITGTQEAHYDWLAIANSTTIEDGFGLDIDGGRLVGVGGTIRNLAAAAMKRGGLPALDVQGFELTRDALEDIIDWFADRPASKRGDLPGIKPDRSDVILGGALVLAAAMDTGGFDAIEVTEAGLREGVFFERLLGERHLFDDVRRESVLNLGHRFTADGGHVNRVAELSLEMFDGLAEVGLNELDAHDRELLWAACVLHDIGTAIDYDDHHRHSQYLIMNAGLPGFTPRELVMVGLIARYHRKGDP